MAIGGLKIGLLLLEHCRLRLSLNTTVKLSRKLLWVHHVTVNLGEVAAEALESIAEKLKHSIVLLKCSFIKLDPLVQIPNMVNDPFLELCKMLLVVIRLSKGNLPLLVQAGALEDLGEEIPDREVLELGAGLWQGLRLDLGLLGQNWRGLCEST